MGRPATQIDPFEFLAELSLNNNRPWFEAHRAQYEAVRAWWLAGLDRVIAAASPWMPELARFSGRDCAYRIYRDTRFSPDKTPYKTYLSAALSAEGRKSIHAGYYIQIDMNPDDMGIFGGVWAPERDVLRKLRHAIADNAEEWQSIITDPAIATLYPGYCGRSLKTAPMGWPKDHPMIAELRLLDHGKMHPLTADFFRSQDWPEKAAELMRPLKPYIDFLNYSIDEEDILY